MVEVINRDIETIERKEVDMSFMKRKSNSKTFLGLLQGYLQKCKNDRNKEMTLFIEELIIKFKKFYPDKIVKIEILQGYKDYDKAIPNIWKDITNKVMIRVWHNESYEDNEITKEAINNFLRILRRMRLGETITCYRIAKELGYGETEESAWQNLWSKRMTDYFPKYYHVCLFLEKTGIINYGKKGTITRLR